MKKIKAFTLIETLIVIIVFCIGILTVLIWLSQTLRNKEYANTQIKSAFFAREWIELMFNLRDANYHKELPRNCIFSPIDHLKNEYKEDENPFCSKWYFWFWSANSILKISMGTGNNYINISTWDLSDDFDSIFNEYQIYFHTWVNINNQSWFIYNHEWNEEEMTWFARYLVVTWVIDNNWKPIDPGKLLKIESHVLYKRWVLTGEKIMETFIWNYEF